MKKLILTAIVAIVGWLSIYSQSTPAPERYNEFLEQMAQMPQRNAEFMMSATMETLSKDPKAYRQMMSKNTVQENTPDAEDTGTLPAAKPAKPVEAEPHFTWNFCVKP